MYYIPAILDVFVIVHVDSEVILGKTSSSSSSLSGSYNNSFRTHTLTLTHTLELTH